jgi:hypothetical protein
LAGLVMLGHAAGGRDSGVFFFCVSEAWAMKQVALCS